METIIGEFDKETRTVPVTFTEGEIVHERDVNACTNEDGEYDQVATQERVAQVAQGVAHKIALGVIRKAEPAPVVEDDVTDDTINPAPENAAA